MRICNVQGGIEKILEQNELMLEKHHQEEFKGMARAMDDTEKLIVLKTIPSPALIDELLRRVTLLEDRDKAIKSLFNIKE